MKGTFQNSSSFTQLCLLALIVFLCAIVATGVSAVYMLLTDNPTGPDSMRIMLFLQNSILFILSPVIAQHFLWEAPFKEALQFRSPHLRIVLLGCLTIMGSSPFVDILNTWNQGLHLPESLHSIEQWMIESERQAEVLTQQILNVSTWQGFIMNILVVAILAGVGEELLFRGVLQKIFIRWTGNIHAGILITAIIFSAIHLQFFGFIPRFVLGALLGYLFVWSRNLWVPIIAHALNNALVVIFTPNTFNEGNSIIQAVEHTDNSTGFAITSIILTAICLYGMRKYYLSSAN